MSVAGRRTLMRSIVRTSLRFRFLVVLGAVVMMVMGTAALPGMRVDVFPEFAPPRVVIQTGCLGLSTSDVEELVTVPLEQALNGMQGLDQLRSKSVPQLSFIELIFKQGTDILRARQEVQERLSTVAPILPTWAGLPSMLAPVSATGRAMQIGMTSPSSSLMEMSMMAYWTIRARLLAVPGVANVSIWNERFQQLSVEIQPKNMVAKDVALEDVMTTTSDTVDSGLLKFSSGSVIGTGGAITTSNQRIGVRNTLNIVTPADLAKVPVPSRKAGQHVTLGDIAQVKYDHQPLIGSAVINGQPGIMLVVEKLPWANTLQMTKGVEQAIAELQPGMHGVTFDTRVFRQSDFIQLALKNLSQALVLGFLLVVIILALFLFEWRVALISMLTIPLSLMATMLVLYWRGSTINTMTLAGLVIALGAVVDDAIIDVENIVRRLRQHRLSGSGQSTASIILEASLEVRSPIVYATLIIVAAAIPVFLLQGLTGAFFRPLAISYTLAIVASMAVAVTLTPALALLLLRGAQVERRISPLVGWLQRGYSRQLGRILVKPVRVYAALVAVTLVGVAVMPLLGQSLFPAFKERDLLMHWVSAPGTSVADMERTTAQIGNELRAIPGVRSFGAHIGQARLGEEVAGVNLGENWVSIDPSADYEKTLEQVKAVAAEHPGFFRDVQTYLDERIEEVLTGGKAPIVIRVYGDDQRLMRQKAQEIQHILKGVSGIVDPHVDLVGFVPQVEVQVDLAKAQRYGLKPGDVRRAAATLVASEEVGNVFRGGKAYNVVVWSTPETRSNVTALGNLPIDTPSGTRVRLADVATVAVRPNPNVIERENGSRRLDVLADVDPGDLGTVVNSVNAALSTVTFPRGYHAEVLGEYQERQAAQNRLLAVAALAGIAILLLLQAAFGSWRVASLVFLTLPAALVGGVLAAWVGGGVLSLGSLVGFFTVFGIAARNGILLINHCQHLEREEGETFGAALVLRGARERLSPILMTSLATGLALVPLVVLGDRPGHEIEHPLAVVILGGLVTSTLLNLFVVPSLYLRFGHGRTGAPSVGAGAVPRRAEEPGR
jgi:CzcA family heavy metal efflux pump